MAKSKKGLGMGLDALLKMNVQDEDVQEDSINAEDKVLAGFAELPLEKINPDPNQPRKNFNEETIDELAQSIKTFGLLQPITVLKRDDTYEIVTGERRYRACKKIGMDKIPVIIKNISQKERLEMSIVENIQRENLNSIEEALAYSSLIESYNVTQEELAQRLGRSRSAITNSIRLLNLDVQIRKWLIEGVITPGHARAILSLPDNKDHISFAQNIIKDSLSVREAEELAKKWPLEKKAIKKEIKKDIPLELKELEKKIEENFSTKVKIIGNETKGIIQISYFSDEEFERILDLLGVYL